MKFSRRTAWDRAPNRLATRLEAMRGADRPILDLTETNPTQVGIPYPEDDIRRLLGGPGIAAYEPDPRGRREAREAVAGIYAARGVEVDPEDIFLTASTSEAYGWIFKLLADPGEEILVPRPSYPLLEFLSRLESTALVPYPLAAHDGWSLDLPALAGRVGPAARAVVVVSPNNPTGTYLKRGELEALGRLAAARGLVVVGDEVFAEYPAGPDPHRATSVLEAGPALTFSLGGLSKLAGLPHLKAGWMVLGGPEGPRREARERMELVADTYLSVNTPVQRSLPGLLEIGEGIRGRIQERVGANEAWLLAAAGATSPCRVLPREGGWSAVLQVPAVRSEEEWVLDLLDQDEVLVHPGYFFDFPAPAFLVLSLLPAEGVFREGAGRILARARQAS